MMKSTYALAMATVFALGVRLVACSDGSNNTDGGGVDSSIDNQTTDAPLSDAGIEGSASDGGLTVLAKLDFAGVPIAMNANNTTHRIYVSLADPASAPQYNVGVGIGVVDTDADTVVATIVQPQPDVGQKVGAYLWMAVDETNNLIYAQPFDVTSTIWVFDGATNTLKKTISVPASNGLAQSGGLAVDPAAHMLYSGDFFGDMLFATDTNANTTSTISVKRPDSLALDPTNHLLFVCNDASLKYGYYTMNTQTNTFANDGGVTTFAGNLVPPHCMGGPGFGVAIDDRTYVPDGGSTVVLFEPANIPEKPDFTPTTFMARGVVGPNLQVMVFGYDSACHLREYVYYFAGPNLETESSVTENLDIDLSSLANHFGAPNALAYVLTGAVPDPKNTSQTAVYVLGDPLLQPPCGNAEAGLGAGRPKSILHVSF